MLSEELTPLYRATAAWAAPAYLQEHPELVDEQTVTRITVDLEDAVERGSDNGIQVTLLSRAALRRALGDEHGAERDSLTFLQSRFTLNDDRATYDDTGQAAYEASERARLAGWADLQWAALGLAADCAWYLSRSSEADQARVELLSCLRLLAEAFDVAVAEPSVLTDRVALEQTATLLGDCVRHVLSQFWTDPAAPTPGPLLHRLALSANAVLPADFTLRTPAGGAWQTVQVARVLTVLADDYGGEPVDRLPAAVRIARESGDVAAWADAVQALYLRLTGRTDDLAGVLHAMAQECDALRATFRSRAGRLYAAMLADRVVGAVTRDAHDEDPATMLELAETNRARLLLDELGARPTGPTSELAQLEAAVLAWDPPSAPSPVQEEIALTSGLPFGSSPADEDRRRVLLGTCETAYAEAGAGQPDSAAIVGLAQVQAVLREDEVLVEYVIPYSPTHPALRLSALVVTCDRAEVVPLPLEALGSSGVIGNIAVDGAAPLSTSPLGDLVVVTRIAIQDGDEPSAVAGLRTLYDVLVAPLLATDLIGDRWRWTVVPTRVLHPVPWSALIDAEGSPLLVRAAITVTPSASALVRLRSDRSAAAGGLGVGNARVAYAGLPDLPGAEDELQAFRDTLIQDGLPCDLHLGPDATWRALQHSAPSAGVLWLATHGAFPETDALDFHRLLLTRTLSEPGPVTAQQIRGLDLSRTWCTVLSVCDGGLYRFGPGDEPYGLVAAFLAAGSANVVAARWEIDDAAARALLAPVATSLLTESPAAVLRVAMSQRIGAKALIRDWAAFVAVGSGLPPA